jgi:two-component system sensor histidine kinase UhpB
VFEETASEVRHDDQDDHRVRSSRRQLLINTILVGVVAVALGQLMLGFLSSPAGDAALVSAVVVAIGAIFTAVIIMMGYLYLRATQRLELQAEIISAQAVRATASLDAFAAEELRVRREVADGLHGTVQHNLVMISVRLAALSTAMARKPMKVGPAELAELADIRADIDNIREHDVRTMSQLLYPVGIDIGAIAAIRLLIQRLPATIAGKIVVSDEIVQLEGFGRTSLSIERRLMIVRTVEEALTNALRHGNATSVAVTLSLSGEDIVVQFDDDGTGLGEIKAFRGIARLRERLDSLGGALELASDSPLGGVRLTARLPL